MQPSSYSVKHECNNDQINKIRKVCFGLCEIFKYGDISTNEVSLHEAVFDKYPDGSYGRIQNVNNEDPINKYSYIYFSHYASLKEFDSLTPETEIKQEASDLLWNGNYLEHNVQINRFIKKLIDLRKAYKNESISYEDYVCLIDSNFSKIFEGK